MDTTPPDGAPRDRDGGGADVEHRMPRWVRGFVIAGIVVALVVVAALLFGGGHGPGRHLPGGGDAEVDAPGGHRPPPGMDH